MPEVQVEAMRQRLENLPVVKKLILRRVERWPSFPSIPAPLQKAFLLEASAEPWLDGARALLESSPALASRIKDMVSSGAFGEESKGLSASDALANVDISSAKLAVYGASLCDFFGTSFLHEWRHCFSTALLTQRILRDTGLEGGDSLPVAALLHDAGKQLLRLFTSKKYETVLQDAENANKPLFQAEAASLQITHADAGGLLLEKWGFTEDVSVPVFQHHLDAIPADFVVESTILQIANWTDCRARGIPCPEPSQALLNEAGFGEIDINYWLESQKRTIRSLEGGLPEAGEAEEAISETHEEELPEEDTRTKPVRLSAVVAPKPAPAPEPVAQQEPVAPAEEEMLEIPHSKLRDGGEATAIMHATPHLSPLGSNPQFQANVVAHVNNPSLSAKEKVMMHASFKEPAPVAPQPAGVGQDLTPVISELPPQAAASEPGMHAPNGPEFVLKTHASIDPAKIEPLPAPAFKKPSVKSRLVSWLKEQL